MGLRDVSLKPYHSQKEASTIMSNNIFKGQINNSSTNKVFKNEEEDKNTRRNS